MKSIDVGLGDFSYTIYIGEGLLDNLTSYLERYLSTNDLFIITDENVYGLYNPWIREKLPDLAQKTFQVPAGEQSKSLDTANYLYTKLLEMNATRHSAIIAFGGGVVGDLAGFIASTFMRGIKFVQVPTTILSQVDSSVGGKVGINHALGKNLIGSFYQPEFVLIDPLVLRTLPTREIYAGLAEVLKYSFIKDSSFFDLLDNNLAEIIGLKNIPLLEQVLTACCSIKARIVEQDEKESGIRATLNFGHTIGHGLEAATHYDTFLHGEAVLHGMRGAIHLSTLENLLPMSKAQQMLSIIDRLNPAPVPQNISVEQIINAMQRDKKRSREGQLWVLLKDIGQAMLTRNVSKKNIQDAVRFVLAYSK
ncbi:3-dehydroquinate synthase [candidate division KSB1 bacterium]|nr:3-dehydroquinate synthase [candidate division KSB1 bacterium]